MTRTLIRTAAALGLSFLAIPAKAFLLCVGSDPRFAIVSDGETIQFDYVGDGTFDLTAPLPLPLPDPATSGIITAAYVIPFALTHGDCRVMGVTQDLSIELIVPSNGGEAIFTGCCRDRRNPSP